MICRLPNGNIRMAGEWESFIYNLAEFAPFVEMMNYELTVLEKTTTVEIGYSQDLDEPPSVYLIVFRK